MKAGRKPDLRRLAYMDRFGIASMWPAKRLTGSLMDCLDRCKDDAARRLLLGVGRKYKRRIAGGVSNNYRAFLEKGE